RDGFRAHGSNRNLQQHIRGDSCAAGSRDSAFIATTSDINETYNIARQYYSSSLFHGVMYRYRIRADANFYSLAPSVSYLSRRGVDFNRFEQIMMHEQSEFVAIDRIPVENIVEAVQLNYDRFNSVVTDGAGTTNAYYVSQRTESNSGVIPALPVPQLSVRDRISAFGSLLTVCFSLRGVNRERDTREIIDVVSFYDARPLINDLVNQ
ncbi:pertussis toxin-like subunit ArtA, partial [Salmonella enterica subsp. enterica serovar Schwarzengrund]|nr:pertussis toxin-like subunit ArtA [Salmonella enterica subsp. enterica serovar Schwarzengrund]ELF2914421.1 pertussis toxin-like subunit ArtA [Salmonella enterica subsp. enterica serovar Schwarzengrund]MHW48083.1 pertussis toxin-like subunit ArtA [Salmonella enterica subsp. enterica serovar Schwarzengrund]